MRSTLTLVTVRNCDDINPLVKMSRYNLEENLESLSELLEESLGKCEECAWIDDEDFFIGCVKCHSLVCEHSRWREECQKDSVCVSCQHGQGSVSVICKSAREANFERLVQLAGTLGYELVECKECGWTGERDYFIECHKCGYLFCYENCVPGGVCADCGYNSSGEDSGEDPDDLW